MHPLLNCMLCSKSGTLYNWSAVNPSVILWLITIIMNEGVLKYYFKTAAPFYEFL
jgi:hypothetical protein